MAAPHKLFASYPIPAIGFSSRAYVGAIDNSLADFINLLLQLLQFESPDGRESHPKTQTQGFPVREHDAEGVLPKT